MGNVKKFSELGAKCYVTDRVQNFDMRRQIKRSREVDVQVRLCLKRKCYLIAANQKGEVKKGSRDRGG